MMMKKIFQLTAILFSFLCVAQFGYAQEEQTESLRERLARRQQEQQPQGATVPRLSVRAEKMNETQTKDLSNATWVREVYRVLDLGKGTNAALYYPVEPIGDRMNLFTMIFKLMAQGDLVAYNFLDGREVFNDENKVNFKDVLERLNIPYQQNGNTFIFNEMDIPSNEVLAYYVKEAWYFDQSNSVLDTKTIAICPVLLRQDDFDVISGKYPQFWIPYENLRPYAARMPIMTSDLNNAITKTVDDYFRMRLFEGEIYKTTNMENKILAEKYKTEEELKQAREKIEGELTSFEKSLWVVNDSINPQNTNTKKSNNNKPKTPKASKPKNTSSSPTYSARDRR